MKKSLFIFLRVIFIIGIMLAATFYGFKFYYQSQSDRAITKSLVTDNLPIIGQIDAPLTIVEFFDYRCPHCSAMSKLVDEAVRNDPQIKIVLRPVVLSGDESLKISTLILAADTQKQGATLSLHKDIMDLPSVPTYDSVKAIAVSKGINVEQAETDGELFKPIVAQNTSLIVDIGFYGVPALVIGDKGFMPQAQMPGVNELRLMIIDAKQRLDIK
jgi:protein-disulfide isomerase